jgi:transcriptional regulator with XRE-family HTH domain
VWPLTGGARTVSPRFAPTTEALGAAVRRLRLDRGLTQRQLSAASSLNTSYVSDIERGRRNPTWESVGRICAALEVGMSELVQLAEEADRRDGRGPGATSR